MRFFNRIPGAAYALAAALLGWLLWSFSTSTGRSPKPGEPAPPFTLADLSGRSVSLSDFRGRPVLVDFWATWCPTCLSELPDLKELHARLAPRGLALLAVSVDEAGPAVVARFAAEHGLPYSVLFAAEKTAADYGVWGLPTKFLIDAEGLVFRKYDGEADPRALEADVETLLKRRPS